MDFILYDGAYNGPLVDAAISRALSGGALDQRIGALQAAVGSPLTAATVAGMTNINKVYVYTGTEAGYTAGHWYYWNGAAWADGGVYNAVAVDMALSDSSNNAVANRIIKAALDALQASADAAAELALASFPHATASGSVASFPDGADSIPVRSLTAQIDPVQAGSGDPSPSNPRAISGWTGANIVVSPTLDAQDGTTYAISFPDPPETVYGGTLTDNGDGTWTLTVTWYSIPGSRLGDTWIIDTAPSTFRTGFSANTIGTGLQKKNGSLNIMCDRYKTEVGSENGSIHGTSGNTRVYITDTRFTTAEAFIEAIADAQFVYELLTPMTYVITADSVRTLLGNNNIFADTGDVSVDYRADPALFVETRLPSTLGAPLMFSPSPALTDEEEPDAEPDAEQEANADE